MARKMCNMECGRTVGTGTGVGVDTDGTGTLCNFCYTEGGWENTHDDEGHNLAGAVDLEYTDQATLDACWICHPEKNLAAKPAKAGHTNTVARSHTSHDVCYAADLHPRTPKGRAACRAAGGPKA